jgi:hypothetical protein
MLFHHVSENRLELKRRRVTGFFFSPRFCDTARRSSLVDTRKFVDRRRKSKSVALKLELEWKRFPNFLTKTIKRCKQRVDGGAGAAT